MRESNTHPRSLSRDSVAPAVIRGELPNLIVTTVTAIPKAVTPPTPGRLAITVRKVGPVAAGGYVAVRLDTSDREAKIALPATPRASCRSKWWPPSATWGGVGSDHRPGGPWQRHQRRTRRLQQPISQRLRIESEERQS